MLNSKLKSRAELKKIVTRLKKAGQRVVFTNGCFDLLHVGHLRYLRRAKAEGDILVIGLNSDESVRRLKGETRPLVAQEERAELLAALEMVDYVSIFDEDTPLNLIRALEPDVLVKGGDWKKDEVAGAAEVEGWGGRVVIAPLIPGRSTSDLVSRIAHLRREARD
jgi:D-beta-D-heptose 7-phosphate kinase/D-beta-D-heptose 1-phosphate adenosyltransferase